MLRNKKTYVEIKKEIEEVKDLIKRYNKDDPSLPSDFVYVKVVRRLQYLRNRQIQMARKNRGLK